VNGVPVANQDEDEQQNSNEQKPGSLRRISCVPAVLVASVVGRTVLALMVHHSFIVRRGGLHPAEVARPRPTAPALLAHQRPRPRPRCYTTRVSARQAACYSRMPALQDNHSGKIARFGVFELDLDASELRKNGAKLRLQEQPFHVLALLLERPGEVVTREDLRRKLWAADTFVDFDHSLNTAVNKLRETLGDSASSPRYVETVARRGYRFIAPVQTSISQASLEQTDLATGQNSAAAASKNSSNAMHPELEVPIPRRSLTRGLFALAQGMYLIFYVVALFRLHAVLAIADSFLPNWAATVLVAVVMVTAGVGIPLRCYLLSAVAFDYQRLGEKFRQMFPFILALDQLWAVAPFLLMQKIGLGAAFATSAALLYVPFSERTLIRLAYLGQRK
jgi:cholera toxin transcriptional activator